MTPDEEFKWLRWGVAAALILCAGIAIYGAIVNTGMGRLGTAAVFLLFAAPAIPLLFKKL